MTDGVFLQCSPTEMQSELSGHKGGFFHRTGLQQHILSQLSIAKHYISERNSEAFPSILTGKYQTLLATDLRNLVLVLQTTGIFWLLCKE